MASTENRMRWEAGRRHHAGFDETIRRAADGRDELARWVARLVGPLDAELEDVSGGGWRHHHRGGDRQPADARLERRKFLARAGGSTFLVKFAGLGAEGTRKREVARQLHAAGFTAEPIGLAHGMLVERWHGDARLGTVSVERDALIAAMGRYLGFRARHLPASNMGASLGTLAEMARHNAGEALGPEASATLERFFERAGDLEPDVRRLATDNRMHRWEWLEADGGLIKTDALDHSAGHDLVGCQDVAWDVAGAAVEHALSPAEAETLLRGVEEAGGRPVSARLVRFLRPCYLAFQLGLWTMGQAAASGRDAEQLARETQRYAQELRDLIGEIERGG